MRLLSDSPAIFSHLPQPSRLRSQAIMYYLFVGSLFYRSVCAPANAAMWWQLQSLDRLRLEALKDVLGAPEAVLMRC
jgi:hypothetical protein